MAGMSRRHYTHVEKNRLLRKFEAGSQTAPEFCRSHQLSYKTFSSWRRFQAQKMTHTSTSTCEFIELELPPANPPKTPASHAIPQVELDLGQGVVLRIFQLQTSAQP